MVHFGKGNQYSSCIHGFPDASGNGSSVSSLIIYAQAHNQVSFSARVHGFTDDRLAKYGPTPRICIDFFYNPDIFAQYSAFYDAAMRGGIQSTPL